MIKLLKSNSILSYVLFALMYFLVHVFSVKTNMSVDPLKVNVLYSILTFSDFFYNFWFVFVVTNLLILIQALWLNYMMASLSITEKSSQLLSFLYILIISIFIDYSTIHNQLWVNYILLFILKEMLVVIKKETIQIEVFNLGLLTSLACIIDYSNLYLFPVIGMLMGVYRTFSVRLSITYLMAVCLPIIWMLSLFYLFDSFDSLEEVYASIVDNYKLINHFSMAHIFALGILFLLCLGYSFVNASVSVKLLLDNRRMIMIVLILFLSILCSFTLKPVLMIGQWVGLAIPLSVFITLLFQEVKHWLFSNILFLLLVFAWVLDALDFLN